MVKNDVLIILFSLLFFFLVKSSKGQQLHHQMLSAQGSSKTLKSGVVILQTVGQQSVTGNSTASKLTVQQGYQQSVAFKLYPNIILTTLYPNPFYNVINIRFSESIIGDLNVVLYNMFGVIIYKTEKKDSALSMGFNFDNLPTGSYILRLTAKHYAYSKILIKQ